MVGDTKLSKWQGGKVYSMSRNLTVRFNGNKLSTPLPVSKSTIKKVLSHNNFDVVHVQSPHSPFMASRVLSMLPKSTPVISTFHILPNSWVTKIGSILLRIAYFGSLEHINLAYAVSEPARVFANRYFGLNTQISPNMVDVARFRQQSGKNNPSKKCSKQIVFLGRLVKRKGCLQLLKAFRVAVHKDPTIHLTIAGDGSQRHKLEQYVNKHNLGDKVEFLGYIDEKDKPRLLASADIAVFPSTGGESFGIVLLEAMAAGAGCVLAGDNLGYRSVLDVKPELLVDANDTNSFAGKLLQLPPKDGYSSWQNEYVGRFDVNVIGRQLEQAYYALGISDKIVSKEE